MILKRELEPERCVSGDATRLHLCNLHLDVDAKRLCATDGHCLVVVPVEVQSGDTSGFVTPAALKAARKAGKKGDTALGCNGSLAIPNGAIFPRPSDSAQFPPWRQIVPQGKPGDVGTMTFGFNARLLLEVAKGIGAAENHVQVTIPLPDRDDDFLEPILVTGTDPDAFGVIMPVRCDVKNHVAPKATGKVDAIDLSPLSLALGQHAKIRTVDEAVFAIDIMRKARDDAKAEIKQLRVELQAANEEILGLDGAKQTEEEKAEAEEKAEETSETETHYQILCDALADLDVDVDAVVADVTPDIALRRAIARAAFHVPSA